MRLPYHHITPGNVPKAYRGLEFDSSDFDRRFDQFMDQTSIKAARKGLGKAGVELMNDILSETPQAPELTSALRSSISVFVNNLFVKSSEFARKYALNPINYTVKSHSEVKKPNEEQAIVVVNASYAAFQHETYHRGYVSTKLARFAYKYIKIVADSIKSAMR